MTERRITDATPDVTGNDHVDVRVERTGEGTVYRAEPRPMATRMGTETAVADYGDYRAPVRDRVRWGPIVAGLATTVTTLIALTVLGLAVGLSVFEPTDVNEEVPVAAGIWSAVSALIAFFVGGWMAGTSVSLFSDDNGLLNGFMVGAGALALIAILASFGAGNLLGGIGNNVNDIIQVGAQVGGTGADEAATIATEVYDEAQTSAWSTFLALGLALGAATLGGLLGHRARSRDDVVAG
jgi:hypothetical protein